MDDDRLCMYAEIPYMWQELRWWLLKRVLRVLPLSWRKYLWPRRRHVRR